MSINIRLKHKRDTATNWESKNPVLLDGEIVLVDDNGTLRIKMGDGTTNYKLLPYFDAPMTAHITNQSNPHKVTKSQVGLGNVDNTADADKSVNYATSSGHAITADGLTNVTATASELNVLDGITASTAELNLLDGVTATTAELNYVDGVTSNIQTQLNAKAALASPTLTGTPKAPTATAGTNSTQIATTAFVTTAVANKTSVASATKATQDASGNVITSTYATKTELTNGLASKANSATTLSGYGITNAYTKTEVDNKFSSIVEKVTFSTSDWGAISNGNCPLTIAKNKACLGVYMTDGSNYNKVEVGITVSGNNNIIYSPNKFSGYALFV